MFLFSHCIFSTINLSHNDLQNDEERETVSSLNEDSLLKGTHIAYFSVDTHMQMQPNHLHTHTPKLHIGGVAHTFSLKSYNGGPHICVRG